MRGLQGKRILIAGSASGIGEGIARRLAEEGAELFLGDINSEGVKALASEIDAKWGWFDLCDTSTISILVEQAATELGGLDGIVNNAALLTREAMEKDIDLLHMDVQLWRDMLDANLIGYAALSKEVLPYLMANGENGGSIVFISSITVHMGGIDEPAYIASKAGVNTLVRHITAMWGDKNIRANAIAPGTICHKRMLDVASQEILDLYKSRIRLPRFGKPEDIAATAAFLLSDDGEWISGQVWAVDGGQTMNE